VDVEAVARQGVVVLGVKGCEVRVLDRCTAPGEYAFRSMSPRAEKRVVSSLQEAAPLLSLSSGRIVAEVERGRAVRIDTIEVGRFSTDADVRWADLSGECRGATHWVRGFSVGAFEANRARGAPSPFSSVHSEARLAVAGDASACHAHLPSEPRPPERCRELVGLSVVPITDDSLR
jgi:hypothetical protein